MPRIKDIAAKFGVSSATVSLVLNNKPGVSKETRLKILKGLEESGYNTNMGLRALQKNNTNLRLIIYKKHGMVVSDTPFFSELIEGIDREARANGLNLMINYINEDENLGEILKNIEQTPQDSIILLATEMNQNDIEHFMNLNEKLVVLDSYFQNQAVNTVVINNVQGAYDAAGYLIRLGHVKIGYLKSSRWINNFDERALGIRKALDDAGLKFEEQYIFELEPTMNGACRILGQSLERGVKLPTAFVADNDIIAFGAMKALKEAGFRIPEDVSMIGFDDMPFCTMIEPALSTVRVFKEKMGMVAVRRLLEASKDHDGIFTKIEIGTELIKRKSVLNLKENKVLPYFSLAKQGDQK
jgi:DNA-binding LacI/PurR family transcriptional regulator